MASHARIFCIARRYLCHQTPLPSAATTAPLLTKLLRAPDAGVKAALDSDDNSPPPLDNASFWDPLLTSLASSSPRKAHLVMEWKLEKLLKDNVQDPDHYSKLISLCGKLGNVPFAMNIFTAMESHGIRPNTCIFNALISAHLSANNFVTALSLFEIMGRMEDCKPDLTTYNFFVSLFSKLGDCRCMAAWCSAAKKSGLSPDVRTYEFMVAGFINSGRFDDAERHYQEMVSAGIVPSEAILESMVDGLCRRKDEGRIKEFLESMADGGWELNGVMADKLLGIYLEMGLVEEMKELLGSLKHNIDSGVLSRVHCGIIRSYALSDRLEDMECSIGRMLEEGLSFVRAEDVEAVICACFRKKDYRKLDQFLDRIRGSHKLARSTYDLLVSGYRKFELYQRLDSVIEEMIRDGFF